MRGILLLVLLAFPFGVQSQEPAAAPTNVVQPAQTQPDQELKEKNTIDWRLMAFTGGLLIVGIVQLGMFFWQLRLMRQSVKDASDAATAARESIDLARKEFIATHRPKIIMRNASVINENGETKILYSLVNAGGTTATIVASWVITEFIAPDSPIRNLRCLGHDDLGRVCLVAGEDRDFTYTVPAEVGILHRFGKNGLRLGDKDGMDLYFTGGLRYADDLGILRTSVFRRKYEKGGFYRTGDNDHEYAD